MSFHSTTSALSAYGLGAGANNPTWEQIQIIDSPTTDDWSYNFGHAVDLSFDGTYLAVTNSVYSNLVIGTAYIYYNAGNGYTLQQQIASPAGNASSFGYSLVLEQNANFVVIGAPGFNSSAGAAYVFTRTGNTWTQTATIEANDKANNDAFGYSLAMTADGSYLAVGATGEDTSPTVSNGATYIFTRSGNTWTQQAKITQSVRTNSSGFGSAVALSNDANYCFVGAYNITANRGDLYLYSRNNTTWTQRSNVAIGTSNGQQACRSLACNDAGTRIYTTAQNTPNQFFVVGRTGNGLNVLQTISLASISNQSTNALERMVTCDNTGNIPAVAQYIKNVGVTFNQPNPAANTLQIDQILTREAPLNFTSGGISISNDGKYLAQGQLDQTVPVSPGKVWVYVNQS